MKIETYLSRLELNLPVDSIKLRTAYKKLISKWHPDKFFEEPEITLATRKAQEINTAYEALSEYIDKHGILTETESYTPNHSYSGKTFTPGMPDKNAFECFLKSSNIISIGFNYTKNILYVKFHSNYVYAYFDVPKKIFEEFLQAPSPGRFRNKFVNEFDYERCSKPNVPYENNQLRR
jgi:curved DNA-binding protein CbpA